MELYMVARWRGEGGAVGHHSKWRGEGGGRGWKGLAQGREWWSTHVPPSLDVVMSRLKDCGAAVVKIASGAKGPSGPGAVGYTGASLKGREAGVQKPRGLRGKRVRPLLRAPGVLGLAPAPGPSVSGLSSGDEMAQPSF